MSANRTVHAFTDDVLADHDATALADLIRRGEISAREAVEAAIRRARALDPHLNAVELPLYEEALQAAHRVGSGPFAGVPTFIKDNTDLAGHPTLQGSRAVPPRPAARDGAFARQFLAQGFIPIGKSRMPEFGLNASTEFQGLSPSRNPWHLDFSTGASSGGSAALVAAGVTPIAHANDGGGSIRIPAACCGLIGLKPSRGRFIDAEAVSKLPVNIVGEGVVTRSVRDTARFFMGAEQYFRNPALAPIGRVEGPGARRLRIGIVYDSLNNERTDDITRAAVADTARLLESLGHDVREVPLTLPDTFAEDFAIYWGMLSFLLTHLGKSLMGADFDKRQLDNLTVGLAGHYRKNLAKTPGVLWRLRRFPAVYDAQFHDVDVFLSPVLSHVTPPLGYLSPELPFEELFPRLLRYVSFTPLNNAAGGPGLTLPMGRTPQGLPVGVHFSAAIGDERTLLELAYEIEAARSGWRKIHAPVVSSAIPA